MNFDNPLKPVHEAFKVASNCFDIVAKTINDPHKEVDGISSEISTNEGLVVAIDNAKKQTAELANLALFATFERYVIEYLQTANRLLAAGHPEQYSTRLAKKFADEVEYWRFGDILDLFKGEIESGLIGEVKQVKQYRDWIAHRNPRNRLSVKFAPQHAFDILTEMIEQIGFAHTLPAEKNLTDAAELASIA
jgi:hypothetical protein